METWKPIDKKSAEAREAGDSKEALKPGSCWANPRATHGQAALVYHEETGGTGGIYQISRWISELVAPGPALPHPQLIPKGKSDPMLSFTGRSQSTVAAKPPHPVTQSQVNAVGKLRHRASKWLSQSGAALAFLPLL